MIDSEARHMLATDLKLLSEGKAPLTALGESVAVIIASLRAQIEAMRPVVEAAEQWRAIWGQCLPVGRSSGRDVADAVDAYHAKVQP